MDVESLERENDRGVDALSDRVGLLKSVRVLDGFRHACASQILTCQRMGPRMQHTCMHAPCTQRFAAEASLPAHITTCLALAPHARSLHKASGTRWTTRTQSSMGW